MHIIIIGSGIAGISFAEKYRALSPDDDITIITRENDGYYSRPLLSRGFSKNNIEQSIILKSFERIRADNITIISGTEVTMINRIDHTVAIAGSNQEKSLHYDKLIIATGSSAFIPPPFRPYNSLFFCLNSLADLKAIRRFRLGLLNQNRKPDWAIIGGGLIGCEVASDLAISGDQVTLFHAMDRLMERQLVPEDSALLLEVLQNSGVEVLLNQNVRSFSKQENKVRVIAEVTSDFDALIVSCGFKPRIELAELAGLESSRGIKVNDCLQTTDKAIYAVGDAAELPDGKIYAFIIPIRNQAHWLAGFLAGREQNCWTPPVFTTKAKVHGFEAVHSYNL